MGVVYFMRKREHFAFLDGYKPALLISPRNQLFETVVASHFPRITPFDDELGSHIFFQTEEQKKDYQKRIKGIELRSYEFNMLVGEVLGFPMKSVEYFSKMRALEDEIGYYSEEESQTKVGVAWAGFFFSSHIDFVEQEIKWLFDTYQHEKAVGLPWYLRTLEDGYIEIPYGNFNILREVVQEIKVFRRQKTIALG
jgi:hypothetical protein